MRPTDFQTSNDRGQTPLMWAAEDDDIVDLLKLLLDRGARIEAKDHNGDTALNRAGSNLQAKAIITLLERGRTLTPGTTKA